MWRRLILVRVTQGGPTALPQDPARPRLPG